MTEKTVSDLLILRIEDLAVHLCPAAVLAGLARVYRAWLFDTVWMCKEGLALSRVSEPPYVQCHGQMRDTNANIR